MGIKLGEVERGMGKDWEEILRMDYWEGEGVWEGDRWI